MELLKHNNCFAGLAQGALLLSVKQPVTIEMAVFPIFVYGAEYDQMPSM